MRYPGHGVVEFLDPIAPGLERDTFMQELEQRIETRSDQLLQDLKRQQQEPR